MKVIWCILLMLLGVHSLAQRQKYYDQIDRTETDPINLRGATENKMEILDFDKQYYSGMLLYELNDKRKKHGKPCYDIDTTFDRITNTITKHFSRAYFSNSKNKRIVIKNTEFGVRYLRGEHRMYKTYNFYYNLTHLRSNSRFYYARGDESTRLKLFVGKRPRTMSPTHEDYVKPVPVSPLTEQEFTRTLIQRLLRNDGTSEFYSKNYSHIGISMRIDEYSINRRRIPHAYIMIVIGGKQTQKVREPRVIPQNNADDNSPYTILK